MLVFVVFVVFVVVVVFVVGWAYGLVELLAIVSDY